MQERQPSVKEQGAVDGEGDGCRAGEEGACGANRQGSFWMSEVQDLSMQSQGLAHRAPEQLSEALEDLGYEVCSNLDLMMNLINCAGKLDEESLAHVVGMMCRTEGLMPSDLHWTRRTPLATQSGGLHTPATSWDVAVLVEAVKRTAPYISWRRTFELLDTPAMGVSSNGGVELLLGLHAAASTRPFPVDVLCGKWQNSVAQLELIAGCLSSAPARRIFQTAERRTRFPEEFVAAEDEEPARVWASTDLIETLLQLAEVEGQEAAVRGLLVEAEARCPDVLLLALAEAESQSSLLYSTVSRLLRPWLEKPSPARKLVLSRVWAARRELLLKGLADMYRKNNASEAAVKHSLSVAKDLEWFPGILEAEGADAALVLDVALLASQGGLLSFPRWLRAALEDRQDEALAMECVRVLRQRVFAHEKNIGGGVPVSGECVQAMTSSLRLRKWEPRTEAQLLLLKEESRARLLGGAPPPSSGGGGQQASGGMGASSAPAAGAGAAAPAAAAGGPGAGGPGAEGQGGQQQGQPSTLFAPDIEEEANSHFQRIYTSELQIESVISMLRGFKASSNQREQEVFACMIHNLFDEYRFFPRYPERELLITGKLFGSLIQHQLVSSITLGIALRYVLEALRKPLRSNMFKFGMCALEQFKQRLVEWPQYCHHILQIAHIRQAHDDLIDYIQRALGNRPAGSVPTDASQPAAPAAAAPAAQPAAAAGGGGASGRAVGAVSQLPLSAPAQQQPAPPQQAQPPPQQQQSPPQQPVLNPPLQPPAQQPVGPGPFSQQQRQQQPPQRPQQPPLNMTPQQMLNQPVGSPGLSQSQAYGAFSGGQEQVSNAFSGFSQGFGQELAHQLPVNLQNFASDSGGGSNLSGGTQGGGNSQENQAGSMDMSAAAQQALSVVSGASAFGATTNVDMLLQRAKEVVAPDSNLQDKIHFIFNNLSSTNIEAKEKDLSSSLGESHLPWLCQYIVIKRAAQESNYHSLYLQLVDRMDRRMAHLAKHVIMTTIENIKVLLADDKIRSSSSVRSLLKNLGSWLGALTLSRNKPILQRDLDFRHLILDAYDNGRLIAVIPFVAKVMDSCANSRIFRPPNPWTMLVLGLLAELHPMPDLKLTIKFEVEVLCKNLNKDLKDIKPSAVFKGRNVVKEGNTDWTSRAGGTGLGALKPLPAVPDARLMAAAANLSPMVGMAGSMSMGASEEAQGVGGQVAPSQPMQPQAPQQAPQQQQMPQQQQQQQQAQAAPDAALQGINVSQYVVINQSIALFQQYPQLRQHVAAAINQAIKDIIAPVVERSVTIACITTRELILKDFVFEADDVMKSAAHMMVQNLAGSLALVTCKEPLRHSMCNQLRGILQKMATFVNEVVEPVTLDQHVQMIAAENLDLGCGLIEKAATEKAVRDMDVALEVALMHRRQPGSPFNEALAQLQSVMRFLPEQLRPRREGGLLSHHKRVYDDFARLPRERVAAQQQQAASAAPMASDHALRAFNEAANAPVAGGGVVGQQPQGQQGQQGQGQQGSMAGQADVRVAVEKCGQLLSKVEELVMRNQQLANSALASLPQGHELAQLMMQSRALVLQSAAREEVAVGFAQKLMRRLHDSTKFGRCLLGVEWLVGTLSSLNDVTKRVAKEVTTWLSMSDNDKKLNRELTVALVSNRLLIMSAPEYTEEMVKVMDLGRNQAGIDAIVGILQHCVVEKRMLAPNDCMGLLEALTKMAQVSGRKPSDAMIRLFDDARALARGVAPTLGGGLDKNKLQDRKMVPVGKGKESEDPAGLREQIQFWLEKWMAQMASKDDRAVLQLMTQLLQQGWLKGDDLTDRFLRLAVDLSVERCAGGQGGQGSYAQVDALSKLVAVLLRYFEEWNRSAALSKLTLLNKLMAAVVKAMHVQHAERKAAFNQRPFHRLLLRLLLDVSEVMPEAMVLSLADVLQALQPRLLPGFSFAWLELVSHRCFMPRMLQAKKNKGWAPFQRLLLGLFKYMEPYLRVAELHEPIKLLYKGALRVLLVLLHDFPEFLCENHLAFCDVIPPSSIQLRNLILSAFPRNMLLPDPFTPQLKVDLLPEINKAPAILSNFTAALNASNLRSDLDAFLKGRGSRTFLHDLPGQLLLPTLAEAAACGTRYNVPLINSLVLYTAVHAIMQNAGQDKNPVTTGASMELFLKLSRDLDTEGRYLLLNAIANQLRFPNSHTHYLSCVLLFLFQSTQDKEMVREQITRVLIERLIVNKPHPWGLLITFIELIKNPTYDFWRHDFVRSSKEIEQLFQSVARFCLPQQAVGQGMAPGGLGAADSVQPAAQS